MKTLVIPVVAIFLIIGAGLALPSGQAAPVAPAPQTSKGVSAKPAPKPEDLDRLLAPIALYPDALLAQMLLCAANPGKIGALSEWLRSHETVKGTDLQDAAKASGFGPSFVALAVFPEVVDSMAGQMEWTAAVGQAFEADRSAVFASIQRLRAKAQ